MYIKVLNKIKIKKKKGKNLTKALKFIIFETFSDSGCQSINKIKNLKVMATWLSKFKYLEYIKVRSKKNNNIAKNANNLI